MEKDSENLLSFKDFSSGSSKLQAAEISVNSPEKQNNFRKGSLSVNEDASNYVFGDQPIASHGDNESSVITSIFSFEYYQKFFDVDTMVVLNRIASAMVPKRAPSNYIKIHIGSNPDLYGPFWIAVTLIFSVAITGNIASYLQTVDKNYHWQYNFHLVSYAACCIFIYVLLLPAALCNLMKYSVIHVDAGLESENDTYTPSFLSLVCVYGYSLVIYIPVSILWLIQISILQWLLVLTAALLSGSILISILSPVLKKSKIAYFLFIGIMATHLILAATFMVFFFQVPVVSSRAGSLRHISVPENV